MDSFGWEWNFWQCSLKNNRFRWVQFLLAWRSCRKNCCLKGVYQRLCLFGAETGRKKKSHLMMRLDKCGRIQVWCTVSLRTQIRVRLYAFAKRVSTRLFCIDDSFGMSLIDALTQIRFLLMQNLAFRKKIGRINDICGPLASFGFFF